ncbi:MAG: GNAT family N-acetyltransferase [Lachnospiraceae bacterium]|nr:GNAT family N-acetyltransferase [Lachnospiraceae bacterium]
MRQLKEADRERLLAYVSKEPEMNLFFIGDLENYGLESDTVSVYVLPDGDEWDVVLLRYFDFYLIYSQREQFQAQAVAEFLRGRMVECISGKTGLLRQMQPFYPQFSLQETYMCRCGVENLGKNTLDAGNAVEKEGGRLCRLTLEDVPGLLELYGQIEEFAQAYKNVEKARERLLADMANGEILVGVLEEGRLVSAASTSASNSLSAMVVGVATLPEFRGRGYASRVVQELCREAFLDGKRFLCLFYDNPSAGRIYHRIGFREIGSYSMMR